jgi:hypothetical protein
LERHCDFVEPPQTRQGYPQSHPSSNNGRVVQASMGGRIAASGAANAATVLFDKLDTKKGGMGAGAKIFIPAFGHSFLKEYYLGRIDKCFQCALAFLI